LTYKWSFGDSITTGWLSYGNTTHSYGNSGKYTVTLTVSDGKLTHYDTCIVQVNGSGGGVNGTKVGGLLSSDTTWSSGYSPYIVTSTITLMTGRTLTIKEGTMVLFYNNTYLSIRGALKVMRTITNPVIFKPYHPSIIGTPWNGVDIANDLGGSADIKFAEFHNANPAFRVTCCHKGGPVRINDSVFMYNSVAIAGYAGWDMIIERCLFEKNSRAITQADKIIKDSIFRDNGYGLYATERIAVYDSIFTGNDIALYGGRQNLERCQIYNNNIGVKAFFQGFTMYNNSVSDNKIGIMAGAYGGSTPPMQYNNLYNNSQYNLQLTSRYNADVKYNWWGTTNTNTIDKYIYDIWDNVTLGEAVYKPFLNSPANISKPPSSGGGGSNGSGGNESGGSGGNESGGSPGNNETAPSPGNDTEPSPVNDTDGDGVPDDEDRFPYNPTEWQDSDDDGVGDNSDKFSHDETQWNDTDGDGYGDNPDGNNPDLFPFDPNEWTDLDRDGVGDNTDVFPNDPEEWKDTDGDGIGDNKDTDFEHDNVPPSENKQVTDAINRGIIGAVTFVDDQGKDHTTSYIQGIEIELIGISERSAEFLVRGESEQGKVVMLSIDPNSVFKVSNPGEILVALDGDAVRTGSFTEVLAGTSDDAIYYATVSETGTQVLVYIPQFSEHTVTIERLTDSQRPGKPLTFYWWLLMILIIIAILIFLQAAAKLYILRRGGRKKDFEYESDMLEEHDEYEKYKSLSARKDIDRIKKQKDIHRKSIYQSETDDVYAYNEFDDEEKFGHSDPRGGQKKYTRKNGPVTGKHSILNKKAKPNHDNLVILKEELISKKDSKKLNYSHRDLASLLETKYERGEISKEVYDSMMEDLRNMNR
ncbi:PKD domain-containing protein, partial [[Eubacterium] cellulosolvens]